MHGPLKAVAGRRIALMINSDGPGGAERMVASLACALRSHESQVAVIMPANGEGWLASQLDGTDVRLEPFALTGRASPRTTWRLARILRRHQVDVIHSHEFGMAVYGAVVGRLCRIPHVITMHGGMYYQDRLRRRLALRAAVSLSQATVAVAHSFGSRMAEDLGLKRERLVTIPNGVAPPNGGPSTLRAELGLGLGDRLLLAVGNLYEVKGHRYLIEALRIIGDEHPTAHVAIAGRGDLADDLMTRARRLGIADRVHLLGLRSDIANLLNGADLFIHPSLSEALPLAVLEAMHAGRPIVATRVGALPTVLAQGEAGLLVDPGDAAALASALQRLLAQPAVADRLARAAIARAQAEYSLGRMVQRYAAIYHRVLGGEGLGRAASAGASGSAASRGHARVARIIASSAPRARSGSIPND